MNEPEREIHRMWREQPREENAMSLDDVRAKAERFANRVRAGNVAAAALIAIIIVVEAWQIWRTPELVERVGDLLTIAAFVYVANRFRGDVAVQSMPAGLGLTSSVDFYRTQLARQRDLASHPWQFLLPFVPGVALSLLGPLDRPLAQSAAITAFGVALFLTVAWVDRRRARRLQREIEELG